MLNLLVVVPVYNERENLPLLIKEWYDIIKSISASKLMIINDGSTDESRKYLLGLGKKYSKLIVINKKNSGHANSVFYGYKTAVKLQAEYVFQTDGDRQIAASDFKRAWHFRKKYDFIMGKRVKRGDGIIRWVISKILQLFIFICFGKNVCDSNVPFRIMRVNYLKKFINMVPEWFYLKNALLAVLLVTYKQNIKWLPIDFKKRIAGKASLNLYRMLFTGIKVLYDFIKFRLFYLK